MGQKNEIEVTLREVVNDLDTIFTTAKFFRLMPQLRETEEGDYHERQYRTAMDGLHPIRDALDGYAQKTVKKGQYKKLLTCVKELLYCQWMLDWTMQNYEDVRLLAEKNPRASIAVTWGRVNAKLSYDLTKLPIEEMLETIHCS